MPKAYEAMRDQFEGEGLSHDRAQAKAARIYNSKAKAKGLRPVGRKESGRKRAGPSGKGRGR